MKILYVASEANPFAASGGLGDVMGALPRVLKRAGGAATEVGVILPLYGSVAPEYRQKMKKVFEGHFRYAWRDAYLGVYRLSAAGVSYYFVDNEQYFKRERMYGEFDDGERFAFFCRAVIEYMIQSGNVPDILHANDWQAALTVVYLKTRFAEVEALSRIQTVFTIHNIEYQGKYDPAILGDVFDLDGWHQPILEWDGCLNLMKGAIQVADTVTTVSPRYAEELCDPYFAYGLAPMIRKIKNKFFGIVNGLDTTYFSPSSAEDLPFPYTVAKAKSGKAANKRALQEELGLPLRSDVPLLVMITRLTAGKGIDLVLHILGELLEEDVQFVLLGTGEKKYEQIFADLCARHPNKARAELRFDRKLSKRMYAGADLFLMPSKTEPCGLAQMTACRYGTVPIVHGVGGLYDTIVSYGGTDSNGFVFCNYNAHDLLFRIKDALALYRGDNEEWSRLVRRAMQSDFSWKRSAEKYRALYQRFEGEEENA